MLCCEVLKEAAVVVVTPLPDDLHFHCIYLFKAKMQQKQHYWSTIMVVTFHHSQTVFSFIKFNRSDNNRRMLIGMAKSWLQPFDDRGGCLIYYFRDLLTDYWLPNSWLLNGYSTVLKFLNLV